MHKIIGGVRDVFPGFIFRFGVKADHHNGSCTFAGWHKPLMAPAVLLLLLEDFPSSLNILYFRTIPFIAQKNEGYDHRSTGIRSIEAD